MALVETVYSDYRFHSRLAARWAVFFDVLGVKYKYRQQSFTFPQLQDRNWTPDFILPGFQSRYLDDGLADTYLSVLERKPSKWEMETGAHLWACERQDDVLFFSRGVGERGASCYQALSDSPESIQKEFAQCPFCGAIYIAHFEAEDGRSYYYGSHGCLEECEFAEAFDIDTGFLDFTRNGEAIPIPTDSPILLIARRAAKLVRFDSPESLTQIRAMKECAEALHDAKIFASPKVSRWLVVHASRLAADEHCPRFDRDRPYIVHAKHRRSGSRKPCPCENCQSKKPEITRSVLSGMKTPDKAM